MLKIDKLKDRLNDYKGTLKSIKEYGGNAEAARALARIILQKPSDAIRSLRWKAISSGAHVDQLILSFPKFKLAVNVQDGGIASELAVEHSHEPVGTEVFLSILKDDMTVVEIGANIGYYTVQESCHRKLKRVIAIEPNPLSFELLKENVQINDCQDVSVFNMGISDVDGVRPFYISKHANSGSMTAQAEYARKLDIPVAKLDTLMDRENIEHVDVIRMDVEGHEVSALRGMLETLKRDTPWICMEYHAPEIQADEREIFISTLKALNYELKCFMFRSDDSPIFGQMLPRRSDVLKRGDLREVLEAVTTQSLLLFIAPRTTAFEMPSL